MRSIVAAMLLVACAPPEVPPLEEVPLVGSGQCAPTRAEDVACVIDGDTFDVFDCGEDGERIRMLGINAPEVAHEDQEAECWSAEASTELRRILDATLSVTLSFDKECTGTFGRTLAYVFVEAEDTGSAPLLVNEYLLQEGFVRRYPEAWTGPLRLSAQLDAAEALARSRGLGLWSACGGSE